jgi:hypothetical protein
MFSDEDTIIPTANRAVWSRDKCSFHVDFSNVGISYNHVFTLPPDKDSNWPTHYTYAGLKEVLLDLCCYICRIMKHYKERNFDNVPLKALFAQLWAGWPLGLHQLCPQFQIVTCLVNSFSPVLSPPFRILRCNSLLDRELFVDTIIKSGDEFFKVELHLQLIKSWLDATIWHHHVLRSTHPCDPSQFPSAKFVSRLKHH